MREFVPVFLLFLTAFSPVVRADQVALTNGDRITGKILSIDKKTLVIKTKLMGEVKIDRSGVASIVTEEPLNVTLDSGKRLVGTITAGPESVTIKKPDNTEIGVKPASVKAIRNDQEQAAWEREQKRLTNPGWLDFWAGNFDFGLATARGNARTTTLSTGARAERVTGFDKLSFRFSQIYSTQSTTEPFGVTANRANGTARYERNLNRKMYGFGFGDLTSDEFQDLDLRSVLGGGFGLHVYKTDAGHFDLSAGGSWSREKFSTPLTRTAGEVVLREESSHKLTRLLQVRQSLSLYPNMSDTGQYRMDFNGGLAYRIASFLSLNLDLTDHYLSNPVANKKKNDLLLTTGVSFTFAQK